MLLPPSLCPQPAVGSSSRQAADGKRQARAPEILLECTGAPSCPPRKFCLCGAVGFCTKSQAGHAGLLAVPTPTVGAQDLLHHHLPGHGRTFPSQREAEQLQLSQSPGCLLAQMLLCRCWCPCPRGNQASRDPSVAALSERDKVPLTHLERGSPALVLWTAWQGKLHNPPPR